MGLSTGPSHPLGFLEEVDRGTERRFYAILGCSGNQACPVGRTPVLRLSLLTVPADRPDRNDLSKSYPLSEGRSGVG